MRTQTLTTTSVLFALAALTLIAIPLGCDDATGAPPLEDAATLRGDSGAELADAGPRAVDAGPGAVDAGTGTGDDAGTPHIYAAVIRGRLAASDLAMAKIAHDMIAGGGEPSARAAGDIAHDVLLGTTLLDSTENEFLAIDRWTDSSAMLAFYSDPTIGAAFGSLFAAPPSIEFFEQAPDWAHWGTMESGDVADPYYWHFALGTLASTDPDTNRTAHNAVASGGMAPSIAAGNLAHVVFIGLTDARRFLAVDIWGSPDNITPFYTNPDFVAAFAPLFESVTQPVYESTDWHQW